MAARLGYVLYWASCILAVLAVAAGFGIASTMIQQADVNLFRGVGVAAGALIWLAGRGLKYIFSGE